MVQKYASLLLALAAFEAQARPAQELVKRGDSNAAALPATFNAVALDRTGWTVTASDKGKAEAIVDNNTGSIWSTQADGDASLTIDMQSKQVVAGLHYLPSQDAKAPGNIGPHTIEVSENGRTWVIVSRGTFTDDASLKKTYWNPRPARYVRFNVPGAKKGASAAEIHVLSMFDFVPKTNWKIAASSEQAGAQPANNAIDGRVESFWHTQYQGATPNFPHTFQIDGGNKISATGMSVHPRSDGPNGRIGKFSVESSDDGTTWNAIVNGTWADDFTPKLADFGKTVTAKFFRLTALSEAGGRGPWASAAEINLLNGPAQYQAGSASQVGSWGETIDFPTIPVAAAVVDGGQLLTWSSWSPTTFGGPRGETLTSTWDMGTNLVTQRRVDETKHDMFCPGISLDAKGRPVVTGGDNAARTSIYNVQNPVGWVSGADMTMGRGYQASATTSEGKIFTIGGSWIGNAGQAAGNRHGEVFDVDANKWTGLPGCPANTMETKDLKGPYRADNHAWLFGWKNGTVFHAGPSIQMNWYGTGGQGTQAKAGNRGDADAMCGNGIMFDAVAGKILAVNGAPNYDDSDATGNAYEITINEPNTEAKVEKVENAKYARSFGNSVVLPDGKVFINGGQTHAVAFSDNDASLIPEIYDPATKKFTDMAPMTVPRTYHSIALLMQDGTVLCGGGGLCGDTCPTNHFDGNIFHPPYLFNRDGSRATRPKITKVSGGAAGNTFKPGDKIKVQTNKWIKSFSLVRAGSATHSTNTDQRRMPLQAKNTSILGLGATYDVTIPSDSGIALPGYWMLFAMDNAGVPSIASSVVISA